MKPRACASFTNVRASDASADGGTNPVFNERFQFQNVTANEITVTIKNKNMLASDTVIGEAVVPLRQAKASGQDHQKVALSYNGKTKGEVGLSLTWNGPLVSVTMDRMVRFKQLSLCSRCSCVYGTACANHSNAFQYTPRLLIPSVAGRCNSHCALRKG